MSTHGNLTWYSSTTWPSTTGIKSDEIFRVAIKVYNNRQTVENFYDIPTTIDIKEKQFTINKSFSNPVIECTESTGNKTCYIDRSWGSQPTNHYWDINPLSTGTYNISVSIGKQEDKFAIHREITISD
ncbi:hypothetical protein GF323_05170 [Candidatus Woesearchaeota archaeon]|nr:hypothetical protein [Candidatus Woesearchaeota archaeon]